MAPHRRRPGLLLVGPRLKDPTPETALQFLHWTQLHFRDLVNVPTDPIKGSITHGLRFAATIDETNRNTSSTIKKKLNLPTYSHDETKGYSPYFYTIMTEDVSILQDQPYYAVSRALDLENTRALLPGEEPVGRKGRDDVKGKMVFDIVNASFAVYEEVETSVQNNASYQTIPLPLYLPTGAPAPFNQPPKTYLIGTTIKLPQAQPNPSESTLEFHKTLTGTFKRSLNPSHHIYTSVYRHNPDAQPEHHPALHDSCDPAGQWLVLVLLVDSGMGGFPEHENVEEIVGSCVLDFNEGREEKGEMSWGLWTGEAFIGKGF